MPLDKISFAVAVLSYIFLLWPCGWLFQQLARRIPLRPPLQEASLEASPTDLPKAGRYIGYFERTIIILLVLRGQYEAIGLLVTAKSIIRVQDQSAREASEYLIVGTLYSFMVAIMVGEWCRWLLNIE